MRATWQDTVNAMLDNKIGDKLALAYIQGRAIEAGDAALRSSSIRPQREDREERREALLAAVDAMRGQLWLARQLLKGDAAKEEQ